MKSQSKLNSQEQEHEQQQAPLQHAQEASATEFATPEEMLRHDALHTPVPPAIAHRLVMEPQARFSGLTARGVVEEIVKKIKVPA